MVAIDLANGVCGAVGEEVVEELYLCSPLPVRTVLSFGEHESLARVEQAVDSRETGIAGNVEYSRDSEEVKGGAARLQDETVRRDEERGFTTGNVGEEVSNTDHINITQARI